MADSTERRGDGHHQRVAAAGHEFARIAAEGAGLIDVPSGDRALDQRFAAAMRQADALARMLVRLEAEAGR